MNQPAIRKNRWTICPTLSPNSRSSPRPTKGTGDRSSSRLGDRDGALQDLSKSAELYRNEGDRHQSSEINRLIQRLKEPNAKL